MIKARLSLVQALKTATDQCEHQHFKEILVDIRKQIEGGISLSDCFQKYEHVFDTLYINLTRVGELAGILDQVLLRIASYQEKTEALRRKIKQALAYPVVVLLVAVGATAFLLTTIVPTFAEMFEDFGAQMPAPTLVILQASSLLQDHFWLVLMTIATIFAGILGLRSRPQFMLKVDQAKLKMPVIGQLFSKSLIAKFCRTLGTLLESGINLVDALQILGDATGNRFLDQNIQITKRRVSQGKELFNELKNTDLFPELIIHMVMVGEQTGELDKMLLHAAEYYEVELDATLESVSSILEPILIVLIGLVLGGILIAMYLPMFDLVNVVG